MTSSHSPRRDSVRVSRATSPSAWSSTTAVTYTPRPATALAALARQKHHTATRPTRKLATLIALGVTPSRTAARVMWNESLRCTTMSSRVSMGLPSAA